MEMIAAVVNCRERGSIGIYENREFTFSLADQPDHDKVFAEWQRLFSNNWEPMRLVRWRTMSREEQIARCKDADEQLRRYAEG